MVYSGRRYVNADGPPISWPGARPAGTALRPGRAAAPAAAPGARRGDTVAGRAGGRDVGLLGAGRAGVRAGADPGPAVCGLRRGKARADPEPGRARGAGAGGPRARPGL